jgi:L-arabinose transport system substrate-binding protein
MLRTTVTTTFAALIAAGAAMAQDDPPRIGYITKMGDHPWFVAEVEGARAAAEELGAELLSQDVQFDANLAITTLDTMIGDGVDGIAIVVPDKALGPVVAARAQEAGIPLIAVDDDITFEDGAPVPYVGMDALSIGQAAGQRLAEIYNAEGWAEHNVRVASIEDAKADTCMRRNQGAEEAFSPVCPDSTQAILSGSPTTTLWSMPSMR